MTSLRFKLILLFAELLAPYCAEAEVLGIWFSPRGGCTEAIIEQCDKATKTIDWQAYNFTSEPIASALKRAADRGVRVRIVLDDDEALKPSGKARDCANAGCEVYLDGKHPIAHNKVRIFDGHLIMGGSFNDSKSAELNAENLYLENDAKVVARYAANFRKHLEHSTRLEAAK